MACDRTGSVEVTRDPITIDESYESLSVFGFFQDTQALRTRVSFGIISMMHPVVHSHIIVITGINKINMSFHRYQGYFAGSW